MQIIKWVLEKNYLRVKVCRMSVSVGMEGRDARLGQKNEHQDTAVRGTENVSLSTALVYLPRFVTW